MTYQTDLFDAMVADVITLTARPDLEAETELALRTATNNAHFSDAYARDLVVTPVQLPNVSYAVQLDIPTLFPKLRGLAGVTPMDVDYAAVLLAPENRVQIIELGDLYDDYGQLRNNVMYLAGDKLSIRCTSGSYGYIVSWFKAPEVRRDTYNSWIAQLYPDAILYWAASLVLDTNGNEEKAAKYMKMTINQHIPFLKSNFLLGELR